MAARCAGLKRCKGTSVPGSEFCDFHSAYRSYDFKFPPLAGKCRARKKASKCSEQPLDNGYCNTHQVQFVFLSSRLYFEEQQPEGPEEGQMPALEVKQQQEGEQHQPEEAQLLPVPDLRDVKQEGKQEVKQHQSERSDSKTRINYSAQLVNTDTICAVEMHKLSDADSQGRITFRIDENQKTLEFDVSVTFSPCSGLSGPFLENVKLSDSSLTRFITKEDNQYSATINKLDCPETNSVKFRLRLKHEGTYVKGFCSVTLHLQIDDDEKTTPIHLEFHIRKKDILHTLQKINIKPVVKVATFVVSHLH